MNPYVIVSPPYQNGYGGIRALHRLIHLLNEKGFDAYSVSSTNPLWNEKIINPADLTNDFIVVYPEIIKGNPNKLNKVVRWVLYYPGIIGGDKEYDPRELVFTWDKDYLDIPNELKVFTIEPELFNKGTNNELDCFWVHKGSSKTRSPITDGMFEITINSPSTREELANLLKRTKTFYTYDDKTQLIYEAMLCGCRVVLLPENIEYKKSELDNLYNHWQTLYNTQLDNFVNLTQKL